MRNLLARSSNRRILAGFVVSGFLFALPGALLPTWGFHLSGQYALAGSYFLMVVTGMALAAVVAQHAMPRYSISHVLSGGCVLAFGALAGLAAVPTTAHAAWRMAGILLIGVAAGLVNTGLFHALLPIYESDPPRVLTAAGICFGVGSLLSTLLVAGTFYLYSIEAVLLALALIPLAFFYFYSRTTFPLQQEFLAWQQAARNWKTLGAILFALLLFFQFGNEWTIAGWLPLYLVTHLGVSPAAALLLLAIYWMALTGGRSAMPSLLQSVRPSRLLFGSAAAALFGCFTLLMTNNKFGAVMGILLIGGGFAPIYPLVAVRIGQRFPDYHPGFFNGIFSLALAGGMLAPFAMGILAARYGMGIMMVLPGLGTCMVVALLLALWLESRVTGR
jgi:hypothetical protein